ncbi:MAG: cytochrome b/b6 domain-containing protein [Methylobacterium radiotolerans]
MRRSPASSAAATSPSASPCSCSCSCAECGASRTFTGAPPIRARRGAPIAAGHGLIYLLMVLVPSLALLRQYGSGKPFAPYGIPVMPARETKIEWMMLPADLFHYWLGFTLLVVVLGHAAMAFLHRRLWNETVLTRMT